MNARGREQQVVWEHPEPLADVQGREKGRESGNQVEIGQRIVEKLGQPYLSGDGIACLARDLLRIGESDRLPCGGSQHRAVSLPCRRSKL